MPGFDLLAQTLWGDLRFQELAKVTVISCRRNRNRNLGSESATRHVVHLSAPFETHRQLFACLRSGIAIADTCTIDAYDF
jgi:hypothetical protein